MSLVTVRYPCAPSNTTTFNRCAPRVHVAQHGAGLRDLVLLFIFSSCRPAVADAGVGGIVAGGLIAHHKGFAVRIAEYPIALLRGDPAPYFPRLFSPLAQVVQFGIAQPGVALSRLPPFRFRARSAFHIFELSAGSLWMTNCRQPLASRSRISSKIEPSQSRSMVNPFAARPHRTESGAGAQRPLSFSCSQILGLLIITA